MSFFKNQGELIDSQERRFGGDQICKNEGETKSMYDINKYTDQELYSILDLCNPSDRELEAKIIQMINKYIRIQTEDGKELAIFFNNIYERFFYQNNNYSTLHSEKIPFVSNSFPQNSFSPELRPEESINKPQNFFISNNENISNVKDTPLTTHRNMETIESFENIEGFDGKDNEKKKDFPESQPMKLGRSQYDKKENIITTTKQVEYTKDYINPILKQTIKRIISVDSQYRTTSKDPLSTSFTFNLSEPLRDVLSLSLYSIHIPYTWYTISKTYGANFIYLKAKPNGLNNGDFDYKIEIEPGNYKGEELVNALNKSINNLTQIYTDVSFGTTKFIYDTTKSITRFDVDITNIYNQSNYRMVFSDLSAANNFGLNRLSYNLNEFRSLSTVSNPVLSNQRYQITSENSKIIIFIYNGFENTEILKIELDLLNLRKETVYYATAIQLIDDINELLLTDDRLINSNIRYENEYYYLTINLNRKKTPNDYYLTYFVGNYETVEDNIIWNGSTSLFKFFDKIFVETNNSSYIMSRELIPNSYKIEDSPYINFSFKSEYYNNIFNFKTESISNSTYTLSKYIEEINTIVKDLNGTTKGLFNSNLDGILSSGTPALLNNSQFIFNNIIKLSIPYNYHFLDICYPNSYFGTQILLDNTYKEFSLSDDIISYEYSENIEFDIKLYDYYFILYPNRNQTFIQQKLSSDINITLNNINFSNSYQPTDKTKYIYKSVDFKININIESNEIKLIAEDVMVDLSLTIDDPFKLYLKSSNEAFGGNIITFNNYIEKTDASYSIEYNSINNNNNPIYNSNTYIKVSSFNPGLFLFFEDEEHPLKTVLSQCLLNRNGDTYLSMDGFEGDTGLFKIYILNENMLVLNKPKIEFDTTGNFYITTDNNSINYYSSSNNYKIIFNQGKTVFFKNIITQTPNTVLENTSYTFEQETIFNVYFKEEYNNYLIFNNSNNQPHIINNIYNLQFKLTNSKTNTIEYVSTQYKNNLNYNGVFDITCELTSSFKNVLNPLDIYGTPITLEDASFNINSGEIKGSLFKQHDYYTFTQQDVPNDINISRVTLDIFTKTNQADLKYNYLYINVKPFTIDLSNNNIFTFKVPVNNIGFKDPTTELISIKRKDLFINNENNESIQDKPYNLNIDSKDIYTGYTNIGDFIDKIKSLFTSYKDNDNINIFSNVSLESESYNEGIYTLKLTLDFTKIIGNNNFVTEFKANEGVISSWSKFLNLYESYPVENTPILMDSSERSIKESTFLKNKRVYENTKPINVKLSKLHLPSKVKTPAKQGGLPIVPQNEKINFVSPMLRFGDASAKNTNKMLEHRSRDIYTQPQNSIITDINIGKQVIFYKDSTITFVPQTYANGLYVDDDINNIVINIKEGSYTYDELIDYTSKMLKNNKYTENSFIVYNNNRIYFYIFINKAFTAIDYNVVFYDFYSFVECYVGYSKIKSIAADDTLGWILGFRSYISYDLIKIDFKQIDIYLTNNTIYDDDNVGVRLIADTAYTKNIYNYFLIKLDDYTQSHLNDGLVTVTNLDDSIPLPSYTSATQVGCNLKTRDPEILGTTVIGMNQLTQNQIYAAQQILNNQQSRQNVLVNFSKGPYVQDIFGFIPIKTSGLSSGDTIIDSSGPLQNQQRVYFGPVNIRRLTIELLNDKGDIVDLNGANWSFSFSCEQLYQNRSI